MDAVLLKAGSFIFIIVLGYLFKKAGIFNEQDNQTIMKLIMKITLPAAVINSFSDSQRDMSLIFIAAIGLLLNVAMMLIGYATAYKKGSVEKAFNVINYSGYNIGTFAMPYLQSFLGSIGIIVACIFDAGNAVMCTGATYGIAAGIAGVEGDRQDSKVKTFFKNIFSSVPFDVYALMLLMYVLDLKFPSQVYVITSPLGSANTFLAMFMIGGAFEFAKDFRQMKEVLWTLFIRFGCAAIFSVILYNCLPYSIEIRQILAIIVFSPVTSLAIINTYKCGGDKEKAALINSMSIVISLVIITALISFWKIGV